MGKAKILVIDDSVIVREAAREALEAAGYTVVAPEITLIVGSVILREKPDLVLLDIDMPTLTGEDVMKLIRRHESIAHTLVVFHSAAPISTLQSVSKSAGTAGYIRKGPASQLVAQVESWLKRHARRRAPQSAKPPVGEGHCLYESSCQIFENLRGLAGAASFWRTEYCDTPRHRGCARFRLSEEGSPVPSDLMPNGTLLTARRRAGG